MNHTSRSAEVGSGAMILVDLRRRTVEDWGRILAREPREAVAGLRFAASRGFPSAQLVLGQMHLDGRGVGKDHAAAHALFARAAALGSADARNMVGRCHELGWGAPVDHDEALRHYEMAASAGHAWGHYNVGCLLLYGDAARRDHAEAFRRFAAASRLGNAKATGLLGRCHEEGWGTPVDRVAAETRYRQSADAGDCWGALNLGLLLLDRRREADAVAALRRAVDLASDNCLAAIRDALRARAEPAVADVAVLAAARMGATAPARRTDALAGPVLLAAKPERLAIHRWSLIAALLVGGLLLGERRKRSPKVDRASLQGS